MSDFFQKIKKLMKIGLVVDSDDASTYPIVFINFLGKLRARAINFTPFGLWNRPPDGAMSMLFNMSGNESNKFAQTNELKKRPIPNLAKGEVVLGNLVSYAYVKADGSIALFINNVETFSIDKDGNITILGNLTMTGDLDVTGDIDASGDITATGIVQGVDLTNGVVPYTTHVHSDPQGGDTGVPK